MSLDLNKLTDDLHKQSRRETEWLQRKYPMFRCPFCNQASVMRGRIAHFIHDPSQGNFSTPTQVYCAGIYSCDCIPETHDTPQGYRAVIAFDAMELPMLVGPFTINDRGEITFIPE